MAIQNRVPVPSSVHELIANTSDGINQSLEIPVKVPSRRSIWRLLAALCFCLSSQGRTYEVSPVDDRSRIGSTTPGKRKTLVLDLDETLVHSSVSAVPDPDYVFTVEASPEDPVVIYVNIRPGLQEFLERAKQHYDIVVYTASLAQYADPLLDVLDYKRLISGRLFRDDCLLVDGTYTKDLGRLSKDMSSIIIVDVRTHTELAQCLSKSQGKRCAHILVHQRPL